MDTTSFRRIGCSNQTRATSKIDVQAALYNSRCKSVVQMENGFLKAPQLAECKVHMETVGEPSKWIALYALKILKRLHKLNNEELMEK